MYILISPAKKQFCEHRLDALKLTEPCFKKPTAQLVANLKEYSIEDLAQLMNISSNLAAINQRRFADFDCNNYTNDNSYPAGFLFQGDVYRGLNALSWSDNDLLYAQNHLAILSGLYGKLRFLDKIQYYRLEMKTKLATHLHKNLYDFWGDSISLAVAQDCAKNNINTLVNLASKEYSAVINPHLIKAKWLNIAFKEPGPKGLRIVALRAKYARGLMASYIIKNKIKTTLALQKFNLEGYQYSAQESTDDNYVFIRCI